MEHEPGMSSEPRASATESLFLAHLDRREDGAAESLEDLCAAHPDHAAGLRELERRWDLVQHLRSETALDAPADALAHLDRPRRTIERYLAGEPIARGAQGTVRRVGDLDLQRHVAMKVRHDESGGGAGSRSVGRFLDEAQVTARLDHPGIVPIHDLGLDRDGRVFFTMKLVQGRSMLDVLLTPREQREDWTLARLVGALLRVAEALAFAHDRGVVHRDLKPANVMLGDYGEVYVMDWGLARVRTATEVAPAGPSDARATHGPLTLDGDVVGTPQYMAPEQAAGRLADVGP